MEKRKRDRLTLVDAMTILLSSRKLEKSEPWPKEARKKDEEEIISSFIVPSSSFSSVLPTRSQSHYECEAPVG